MIPVRASTRRIRFVRVRDVHVPRSVARYVPGLAEICQSSIAAIASENAGAEHTRCSSNNAIRIDAKDRASAIAEGDSSEQETGPTCAAGHGRRLGVLDEVRTAALAA